MNKTKKIAVSGALVAMEAIMTRFMQIPVVLFGFFNDRISLGFIPVCLAAMLFGPLGGGIIAGVADLLRAIIFPQGDINLLFTLTAAFRGVVYGLFLHKKITPFRALLASAINYVLINILLMSVIIKLCYTPDAPFIASVTGRFPVATVNFVVQSVILMITAKPIERIIKNV